MTIIMFSLFFFFSFWFCVFACSFSHNIYLIFHWFSFKCVFVCMFFFAFIFNIFRNSIQKMSLIRLWMEIFYFFFIIAVSFPYFVLLFFHCTICNAIQLNFQFKQLYYPLRCSTKKNYKKPEQTSNMADCMIYYLLC